MHRYSAAGHGHMIADVARVDAYARAIERCVRPGDAVLEIGTGTGLFAMLACRAGARRVFAVEADDIIEVARANARANGLDDRIEFRQALSTEIELPERVDTIVSDLRGVLPVFEGHLAAIIDARTRFLAPGGRLIPAEDRIMVACVAAPDDYAALTAPWSSAPQGLEMHAGTELVLNDWRKTDIGAEQLVTQARCCAVLRYAELTDTGFASTVALAAVRHAECHGLALWFESTLAEGAGFSCGPGARPRSTVYGHAFYPWPRPLDVKAGDTIEVVIGARLVAGQYIWTWETRRGTDRFRQSTFHAEPVSPRRLAARAASHVAVLGAEGRVDRFILESLDSRRSLGDIATQVRTLFPDRFARWEEALARVGDLAERYAR